MVIGTTLRYPVTSETIEHFLMHACRVEKTFQAALAKLDVKYFNHEKEHPYFVLWTALREYYGQWRVLPDGESMMTYALSSLKRYPSTKQEEADHLTHLLEYIYTTPLDRLNPPLALEYMKAFLFDRQVGDTLEDSMQQRHGSGTLDYPTLVRDVEQITRQINQMRSEFSLETIPDCWHEQASPKIPLGITFIDEMMGGGSEAGDVNVILGATGVGKTLMGIQQMCAYAQTQYHVELLGGKGKMGVYISYEDNMRSLQIRAMCRAAYVDKTRLENMTDYPDLSTITRPDSIQPYEHQLFAGLEAGQEDMRMGEQERLAFHKLWLNNHFVPVDFSLSQAAMGGNGGIPEIRTILEAIAEQRQRKIGYCVVDWAGMAVRRRIRTTGGKPESLAVELGGYVQEVHETVAIPMGIPVTVLHQLRGQANKRAPTVVPDHADAEWCASFAVNAFFVLTIGTKDRESSACLVCGTKTRRGAGGPAVLCRINGAFGELVPADKDLVIDGNTHKIVRRADCLNIEDLRNRRMNIDDLGDASNNVDE